MRPATRNLIASQFIARKRRNDAETQLQIATARFLELALPPEIFCSAINPIPAKSKAAAGLSKAMGLKPGVFDLFFLWPTRQIAFIEMKAEDGRASDKQLEFAATLSRAGIPHDYCRSVAEVESALRSWGIKLKATVGGR